MKTLKDLTPDECIKIASISEPTIEWKFVQSSDKWDGFDLVGKDCKDEYGDVDYIFQIDYSSDEELNSRFRLYENLCEYTPSNLQAISNYLMSIECNVL